MGSLLDPALPRLVEAISQVLLGKQEQVRLALACLLAGGHLLIEDRPGMGKSTLAETLARGSSLAFKRVSFTSDLLPADLTGINVFDSGTAQFRFQAGPLFSQVLLADEINRASPRTQSALLEAMAAGRVSVDGTSHLLPQPFFVIATQNSLDQVGTSPLPEAQLDRFLMRISLGFPTRGGATLLAGNAAQVAALEAVSESGCCISSSSAAGSSIVPMRCWGTCSICCRHPGNKAVVSPREPGRDCWRQPGAGRCCRVGIMCVLMTCRPFWLRWLNTAWMPAAQEGAISP